MAEYTTGTATGPGATDALMQAVRTHLLANGWTQLHSFSETVGSKDYVMRGAALDATADNRPIVRLTQTSATRIVNRVYSDWDTGTNTGIGEAGSTAVSYLDTQDASFSYFLKANQYAFYLVAKIATSYNKNYCGFTRRGLGSTKSGITKSTGSIAIGATNIPTASDMSGKLKVGQKIHIQNYAHSSASLNKENCELVEVLSITGGGSPSITLTAAVTKNYDAGALIGQYPMPVMGCQFGGNTASIGTGYHPFHGDGSRTGATNQTSADNYGNLSNDANTDPDEATMEYVGGLVSVSTQTAGKTGFKGFLYHVECCTAGGQAMEDIMDDGDYTFVIVSQNPTTGCAMIGPREI